MKRLLFLALTGLLAALFVVTVATDSTREWTSYQRTFFRSLSKDERRGLTGGIQQFLVADLRRVDRCTTCHLAIDKPALALAEQPFTAHPGDYLKFHPPEKFGCTICHGGQGLATETKAAHGEVRHWEQPLLRGPLVQASCYKCHGDLKKIESHVPQLVKGKALYTQLGCAGCHAVHGFGQTVSIDLSEMGDKPWELLDFTFVSGRHDLAQWTHEHFMEPRKVTPGFRAEELPPGEEEIYPTFMPDFGLTEERSRALTIYMLSLTDESLPAKYVTPIPEEPEPVADTPVERGRAVFQKFGCIACHGDGGRGGRRNWNSVLNQEVPPLVYVKAYYDNERLKQLIRNGRQPTPRLNATRPRPPLYMPAWKERISEPELDDLVEYLFSLYQDVVGSPAAPDTSAAKAVRAERSAGPDGGPASPAGTGPARSSAGAAPTRSPQEPERQKPGA